MSGEHASYGFSGSNQAGAAMTFTDHRDYIQEAIDLSDQEFDFGGMDAVLILAPPSADSLHSPAFVPDHPFWAVSADGQIITSGVTRGADWYGAETGFDVGPYVVAHEMGHTLGLADLYEIGAPYPVLHERAGNFGIMGILVGRADGLVDGQPDPLIGNEMLAWHRWQLGWLDDQQVACIASSQASLELSPIAFGSGVRAAVIPIGDHKAVVVESRRQMGYDEKLKQEGVLVYTVDTTRLTGTGPVTVHGEFSGDWPDASVLLQPGERIVIEGHTVSVERRSAETDFITIVQTP
jgi:M6 family metalloprotease-like protein